MAVTNGTPPSKARGEIPLRALVKTTYSTNQLQDPYIMITHKLKSSAEAPESSDKKMTLNERAYFRGALDLAKMLLE